MLTIPRILALGPVMPVIVIDDSDKAVPLAEALLEGRFGDGDLVEVRLDPATDRLIFGFGSPDETGAVKGALSDSASDAAGRA